MFFGVTPTEEQKEAWSNIRIFVKDNRFFYWCARRVLDFLSIIDGSVVTYWWAVIWRRPYWGGYLRARQNSALKIQAILDDLELRLKRRENVQMLEVGSYAGQSAVMYAGLMKKYGNGHLTCIDPWKDFEVNGQKYSMEPVYRLFLRNVELSGVGNYVSAIRSTSSEARVSDYDIVYIDGDHSYTGVRADILKFQRHLLRGGVLCGDDFNLSVDEIDMEYALAHRDEDYIQDPKTERYYHPGVTLAVSESFPQHKVVNETWFSR